jgi:hypothetical protein
MRGLSAVMKKMQRQVQLEQEIYQKLVAEHARSSVEMEPQAWADLCQQLKKAATISAKTWTCNHQKGI